MLLDLWEMAVRAAIKHELDDHEGHSKEAPGAPAFEPRLRQAIPSLGARVELPTETAGVLVHCYPRTGPVRDLVEEHLPAAGWDPASAAVWESRSLVFARPLASNAPAHAPRTLAFGALEELAVRASFHNFATRAFVFCEDRTRGGGQGVWVYEQGACVHGAVRHGRWKGKCPGAATPFEQLAAHLEMPPREILATRGSRSRGAGLLLAVPLAQLVSSGREDGSNVVRGRVEEGQAL